MKSDDVTVIDSQEKFDSIKASLGASYPPVWDNIKEFGPGLKMFVLVGGKTVSSILTSFHKSMSTYCVRSIASYPASPEFFRNINVLVDAMFNFYEARLVYRWLFLREVSLFKSTMRRFQINRDVASLSRYTTMFYGSIDNNTFHNEDDFFFKLSLPYLDPSKRYVMVECVLKNDLRLGSAAFIEDYEIPNH